MLRDLADDRDGEGREGARDRGRADADGRAVPGQHDRPEGPRAAGPGLSAGTRRQSEAVADVAGRGGDRCRAGVPRRGTGREGLRPAPGGRERRAGCEAAYRVGLGVDLLRSQPAQRIPDHCRGVRRPSSRWRHRRVPWSGGNPTPKPHPSWRPAPYRDASRLRPVQCP